MWIHEHKNWPNFTWNIKTLASKLVDIRHRQGRLLGKMENLSFDLKRENSLNTLTSDVLQSSAIEGVTLNKDAIRSSIAQKLGMDNAGQISTNHDADGIVEMTLDATQQYTKPLSKKRLFAWHELLFPMGRSGMNQITVGRWRIKKEDPMQVVSGPVGKRKVHFEAPNAKRLANEMRLFLTWFRNDRDIDPVIKAGMAHIWFVSIHPFADGNGRIARAISDMALACADGTQYRYYSLSTQIEAERKDYYKQLERQQRGTSDITSWLGWFLDCLGRAISSADSIHKNVLYKAEFWNIINQQPVNMRQKLIINRMLEDDFEGYMNTSKYAILTKCSNDTALRDIQELKAKKIFTQNPGGGRSTSYRLTDVDRLVL